FIGHHDSKSKSAFLMLSWFMPSTSSKYCVQADESARSRVQCFRYKSIWIIDTWQLSLFMQNQVE
ncbi:hypothetical protein AC249_AIPGENE18062, partial [Exaiptasia diaphana]